MRRSVGGRAAAGLVALFAALAPGGLPAQASPPAAGVIVLDGATSAEGIAAGRGTTFYAGELETGDIFRGDIHEDEAEQFIDAPEGRQAVGMKFDARNNLLFVAGGQTGKAFVYNTKTGEPAGVFKLAQGFINDVTLTEDGAWFTNSVRGELYRLQVNRDGTEGEVETLQLKGPAAETPGGFNLNGIASAKSGRVLIVAHSAKQALFTVDPESGESARITADPLPNIDGILACGRTLWAVQNQKNQISRIELSRDLRSGTVQEVITSPDFNVPTTAALFGNTLAAVNAQFGQAPGPHEVVLVPARQHHHED